MNRNYSKRVTYHPPITLYCPLTWRQCKAAHSAQHDIHTTVITVVGETQNTIYVVSASGREYSRHKSNVRTFHTEIQAIQATIADLEDRKRIRPEEAYHIQNVINFIRESRGL